MNVSSSEVPALLNTALQRLAAQSAACKLWSIVLTSAMLAMIAGRGGDAALAWAAAPALLLALADAAYKVQAGRIAALAASAKETVRVEDLFRMQSGSAGFAASLQSLSGLTSFSVWPFYAALAMMVIVLGQTALLPQDKPSFSPSHPSINASPYQPNAARPSFSSQQSPSAPPHGNGVFSGNSKMPQPTSFIPPKGAPSFPPPPKGVPTAKPNIPRTATGSPAGPRPTSSSINRPATSTFPPPVPATTNNGAPTKPGSTQAQPPK